MAARVTAASPSTSHVLPQFLSSLHRWNMIQLLSWDKQQMLAARIPWSCLNSPSDAADSEGSYAKVRRANHVKEERRRFEGSSPLPPNFG